MANEQLKIVYLQSGPLTIELLEYQAATAPRREAGTIDHLAFSVPDIHAAIKALKDEGIKFLSDGPRQAMTGRNIIFLSGPDGERIELMEELVEK
jgi:catechol 2,3-dioxygenase-like lactoylglutathione lyase family enzyme